LATFHAGFSAAVISRSSSASRTVSYLHMQPLVELHGQPGWVAALTPLSVDGMIVAASTTLLADSRAGQRGGMLPWALLMVGSAASSAATAGSPGAAWYRYTFYEHVGRPDA
jgi:hypothetical protein